MKEAIDAIKDAWRIGFGAVKEASGEVLGKKKRKAKVQAQPVQYNDYDDKMDS
jgi:hypothetical protein